MAKDWTETALLVFQRQKYRGAVGMLIFAFLIVCGIFFIAVLRASDPLLVALIAGGAFGLLSIAVVLVVRKLGALSVMEASQVAAYLRMAAKSSPAMPPVGPPVIGSGDTKLLEAPPETPGGAQP